MSKRDEVSARYWPFRFFRARFKARRSQSSQCSFGLSVPCRNDAASRLLPCRSNNSCLRQFARLYALTTC